jgi:hypothetical protein
VAWPVGCLAAWLVMMQGRLRQGLVAGAQRSNSNPIVALLPHVPCPPPPHVAAAAGCPAYTVFMPTGDPLVPQWCVTYKNGKSKARHGCYGRLGLGEIVATVGCGGNRLGRGQWFIAA